MASRSLLAALSVAILALCGTGIARAGSIYRDATTGDLVYQAPDDPSRDHVLIGATSTAITFQFDGALHQGGVFSGDCTVNVAQPVTTASCPIPATRVVMALGDGDDYVSVQATGLPVPLVVTAGPGDDLLTGGLEADTFSGGSGRDLLSTGDGDDVLDGGTGPDELRAGGGSDTIAATDGTIDRVDCGDGVDGPVDVDTIDELAGCEAPRPTNALEPDRDHDGFSRQTDCNDDAPTINPAAADLPDDGVDQNCDGRDAHVSDRDGDGVPEPFDCNDRNPAIHPGAAEVPGNNVDENCNGRADPWQTPLVTPVAMFESAGRGGRTLRVRRLTLIGLPARARVAIRCSGRGCPFRAVSVRASGSRLALTPRLRRARLQTGARIAITVSSPGNLDAVIVFLPRPPAIPAPSISCRAPGTTTSRPCVAVA
jgi:hypothetical protein